MESGEQILEQQPIQLYESRKKIHPRYQKGFFRTIKWAILWTLLGLYYLVPFLNWERAPGLPQQAVLFDLPARKFYIYDLVIWPQEIFLLTLLLIISAIGLFFITTLAGRAFCGYMCPQTVWTDLFLFVENLVEGPPHRRKKLDNSPWNGAKILKKTVKHLLWLLIGLATGGAFVFYFADAATLMEGFLNGTAPSAAWTALIFLTLGTYVFAGLAREQVCIYMCPYARFQGAMFDADTLIIAYDERRGENRIANRRDRAAMGDSAGDCIDCGECFRVCPTGIDIRDGQQYECITCAACVDACDEIMDTLGKPRGLIRYTSMRGLEGLKTRFFRPRLFLYGAVLALFTGIVFWSLTSKKVVDLNVIKDRKPLYIMQKDGSIQNNYTVRILNRSNEERWFSLSVEGLNGAWIDMAANRARDADGWPVVSLGPGEVIPYKIYLRQPKMYVTSGSQEFQFVLHTLNGISDQDHYNTVFMRP
ncbi:MAG: cytochrome c oxidase accessory protein CcoG [Magnetococcales bacterium]|nr:cytochrome c oxidase accessory protein CcoG [Magnetococcales bacterium]